MRKVLSGVLCVALVVWSVFSNADHTPTVLETIQDHLEMIADHGHSHGFEEDLFWAIHGHSHDAADHDHSQVFLIEGAGVAPTVDLRENWHRRASAYGPSHQFRIKRPPRA